MPGKQMKRRAPSPPLSIVAVVLLLAESFPIDSKLVMRIERLMREQITSDPKHTELHVWLVGPGGCATAAYLPWRLLRGFGCFVRIVVPAPAWSATTLIALGGDEIVMGPSSCLGPLDPQFRHGEHDEEMCGLDIVKAPELYAQQATGFLEKLSTVFPDVIEMTPQQTIRLTTEMYELVVDRADLVLAAKVQRAVKQPIRYLMEIFAERVCPTPDWFNAAEVAKHFVYGFDTHIDAIHRDHLRALGLPVADLETYAYCTELWEVYDNWLDRKNVAESVIEVRQLDG